MKPTFFRIACLGACLLILSIAAAGQKTAVKARTDDGSFAAAMLKGSGKAVVIVVGSAAKSAWVTTEFVTKNVAGPVAKTVLIKMAPKIAGFAFKQAAKKALPLAVKLSLL